MPVFAEHATSTPITSEEQWHELRAGYIGCSEVAATLGVHEYQTPFGLVARKLGNLPKQEDNPVFKRGRLLEPIARQLLKEIKPEWEQIEPKAYYHDDSIRFGATPDLFVRDRERLLLGVVQIKTVTPGDFARKWHNDSGVIEPPLWIAIQVMGEQYLTGADFAFVAVLVVGYGLDLQLVEVAYIPELMAKVRERVVAVWELIDRGELPQPDYGLDQDVLAQILRQDDGSDVDMRSDNEIPDLVATIDGFRMAKRTAQEGIDEAQARLLHKIGPAKHVKFAGGTINASTVNRKEYVVPASSYRKISFRFDRRSA